MSEALDYLLKVRPDALGHYFRFLKLAGASLDPKTRALISVITKVHAQTERGLRQYLRRALEAGVKPAEVLDALLLAMPALGMSRIVWAVDVILKMDLPEFGAERLGAAAQWHDVAQADQVGDAGVQRIACDGRALFVTRQGNELRVYDSRCPHQGTDIPAVAIKDGRIACLKHGWTFDAASGECVAKGNRPLTRLDARVEGGRLQAFW